MRSDLMALDRMMDSVGILWSKIAIRFERKGARSHSAVENCRRKLNVIMGKFCRSMSWDFIRHALISLRKLGYTHRIMSICPG